MEKVRGEEPFGRNSGSGAPGARHTYIDTQMRSNYLPYTPDTSYDMNYLIPFNDFKNPGMTTDEESLGLVSIAWS